TAPARAALRSGWLPYRRPRSWIEDHSCRIRRVFTHVSSREVGREDRSRVRASRQVDGNRYPTWPQVHGRPVLSGRTCLADPDAIDRYVELVGLEDGLGGSDCG